MNILIQQRKISKIKSGQNEQKKTSHLFPGQGKPGLQDDVQPAFVVVGGGFYADENIAEAGEQANGRGHVGVEGHLELIVVVLVRQQNSSVGHGLVVPAAVRKGTRGALLPGVVGRLLLSALAGVVGQVQASVQAQGGEDRRHAQQHRLHQDFHANPHGCVADCRHASQPGHAASSRPSVSAVEFTLTSAVRACPPVRPKLCLCVYVFCLRDVTLSGRRSRSGRTSAACGALYRPLVELGLLRR